MRSQSDIDAKTCEPHRRLDSRRIDACSERLCMDVVSILYLIDFAPRFYRFASIFYTTATKLLAYLVRRPEAVLDSAEEYLHCKEWAEEFKSWKKRTMFLYSSDGFLSSNPSVAQLLLCDRVWGILEGAGGTLLSD